MQSRQRDWELMPFQVKKTKQNQNKQKKNPALIPPVFWVCCLPPCSSFETSRKKFNPGHRPSFQQTFWHVSAGKSKGVTNNITAALSLGASVAGPCYFPCRHTGLVYWDTKMKKTWSLVLLATPAFLELTAAKTSVPKWRKSTGWRQTWV